MSISTICINTVVITDALVTRLLHDGYIQYNTPYTICIKTVVITDALVALVLHDGVAGGHSENNHTIPVDTIPPKENAPGITLNSFRHTGLVWHSLVYVLFCVC